MSRDETVALARVDELVRERIADSAGAFDEDCWEVPATWWRQTEPFRGKGPVRSAKVDQQAPAAVTALVASVAQEFTRLLDHPESDAELREAAKRQLSGETNLRGTSTQESTPLGAAVRGLRKDVRTIARDQIRRMEHAMVTGRRWTGQEHRRLFVEHPLLRHLARRLVWATFDDAGTPTGSFRVAEDQTFAGSDDDQLTVPDDAVIGIAHTQHLDAATLQAWTEVLSDYELLQPFDQLEREVFTLTPVERTATTLARFHGTTVPTGRVLGIMHRGWQRGRQTEIVRDVGGDRFVVVDLDPGIPAGAAMQFSEQRLERWRAHPPLEQSRPPDGRPET